MILPPPSRGKTYPLVLSLAHVKRRARVSRGGLDLNHVQRLLGQPRRPVKIAFIHEMRRQRALSIKIDNVGCFPPCPREHVGVVRVDRDEFAHLALPVFSTESWQ